MQETNTESLFMENINELTEKKQIILPTLGKSVSSFAEEVGEYFTNKHILFFRPTERCVVKLEMIPVNKEDEKKVLGFQQVKGCEFVTLIEKYFSVGKKFKVRHGEEEFENKSLSRGDADITLASEQFKDKLPVIERIFTVPIPLLDEGKLTFPRNGYDKRFWSWLPDDAPKIREDMPLYEAINLFDGIYREFCFKDTKTNQDKTNAIAGLLTPFCRRLYSRETCRTPIIFFKGNRERVGKDFCAGISGITYEGEAIDETPLANGKDTNDDEFRKKVLSTFKIGKNRLHLSNNKGFINSGQLEMLATSENWSDRQLGSNTILTFPNTLELSMSANTGVTYTPDLANRCLFINLSLEIEDPNKREFDRPDLHQWVKEHREDVLSALFSLVRNWHEKGMPPGSVPFASFPEWARVVGGIMEAAGYPSPCVNNDDVTSIGGDNETKDMKKLFELCYEKWPNEWKEKKAVMDEIVSDNSDFSELFGWLEWGKDEKSARTRFALLLRKFVGRELSSIILSEQDSERSSRRKYLWKKSDEKPKDKQQKLGEQNE